MGLENGGWATVKSNLDLQWGIDYIDVIHALSGEDLCIGRFRGGKVPDTEIQIIRRFVCLHTREEYLLSPAIHLTCAVSSTGLRLIASWEFSDQILFVFCSSELLGSWLSGYMYVSKLRRVF